MIEGLKAQYIRLESTLSGIQGLESTLKKKRDGATMRTILSDEGLKVHLKGKR